MLKHFSFILLALLMASSLKAQNISTLNSDSAHLLLNKKKTSFGGYGSVFFQRDFGYERSKANLDRFVLITTHQFNTKFSVISELEIENAKVTAGEGQGEVALEQMLVKYDINAGNYIVAGLFIPRIGYQNENHLPTQFFGVERNLVETYIIPATWREIGVGFFGSIPSARMGYSLALLNGLDASSFEHGSVFRGGRFEGQNATASNLAVTGSAQLYAGNFKFQVSSYIGGSAGLTPHKADSLQLESGMFGTPVILNEADVQFIKNALSIRLLGVVVNIPDADAINRAYANNTPEMAYGGYAELAYNLMHNFDKNSTKKLFVFARYENYDLNAKIPVNGILDKSLKQSHIITGISYLPINNVAIKADIRIKNTGPQNPALILNPSPSALIYKQNNTFLNIGLGYSF